MPLKTRGLDDIYGPTTTRQILEAKHMKRALETHMTTVQALYDF